MITSVLLLAQSSGVNLAPIIIAVVAALGGSGATAWLTITRTNKKLEAESELIYQQALKLADERAAANVETMERITQTLSSRLDATEEALEMARKKLADAELKIRELEAQATIIALDKDRALAQAQSERDSLQRRVLELEERYADLVAALPGRRRRDPKTGEMITTYGIKGEPGERGDPGLRGDKGDIGRTGDPGRTGDQGERGISS